MVTAAGAIDPRTGRMMQGYPNWGSPYAPPIPKKGWAQMVGGALNVAKSGWGKISAHPAAQAAAQGAGAAAGWVGGNVVAQPVKGFLGWFVNFWPENVYGWFMLAALGLYYLDWRSGFNIAAMANFHVYFAIAAFFIIGFYRRFINGWLLLAATFFYFSLNGMVQADSMRERALGLVVLVASIAIFNLKTSATGAYRLMPLIAFLDIYGIPVFSERLINYAGSFGVTWVVSLVANSLLFPVWLWFGMLAFTGNPKENKEGTRVAGRFLALVVVFYLIVALPHIKEAYAANVAPGLTAEQEEQKQTILTRFQTNMQRIVSGEFLKPTIASAQESFEQTFGFGTAKEEPKLGLQLSQNSQMPKEVPDFKPPEPSFVMGVPNPFPADSKNPYIEVTEIKCEENSGKKLTFKKAITDEGVTVTDLSAPTPKSEPVEVYYSGPRGGNEVKCLFEGWQSGEDYNIGAEVTYKVENSAYLSTTFMRSDFLRGLRLKPDDPKAKAILDAIPPAGAEYRNVPVTLTWGPRVLPNAPVPIDLDRESNNLAIIVYVAKNPAWENSEITAVEQLGLLVPKGVALVLGDSCDFVPSDADSGDGRKWYVVDPKRITKNGKPRFIGDAIRFDCGMSVTDAALGKTETSKGKDTAAARFEVSGSFEVTTKLKGITFTYGDGEGSGTAETTAQPTQQQLQDKCTATSGIWKAATATADATCDCGTGKKWDVYPNGCVASAPAFSPPITPTQPLQQA